MTRTAARGDASKAPPGPGSFVSWLSRRYARWIRLHEIAGRSRLRLLRFRMFRMALDLGPLGWRALSQLGVHLRWP